MRKIPLFVTTTFLIFLLFSCKKSNLWYKNYDYTTAYFPYQYPFRTLILGDYNIADNTNDNNLKFLITARIGGLLNNNSDWSIGYVVDNNLANKLITDPNSWDGKTVSSADTLEALPSRYYTLGGGGGDKNTIIVPKGSFTGSLEIQLTQDFLDDTMAWRTHYIIPLKITTTTADSILSGRANSSNADPRVRSDWAVQPMNFTVFGIKFINAYHGNFLHRGKSVIKDGGGNITQTITYNNPHIEDNEVWHLQTIGRNMDRVTGVLRSDSTSPGDFSMNLTFNANGDCIISTADGSLFPVNGTGKFIKEGDVWGGTKRNTIYLDYEVKEGTNTHSITDTLVFRDKGVSFQEYAPVIIP
jgi:hypothetical protein